MHVHWLNPCWHDRKLLRIKIRPVRNCKFNTDYKIISFYEQYCCLCDKTQVDSKVDTSYNMWRMQDYREYEKERNEEIKLENEQSKSNRHR